MLGELLITAGVVVGLFAVYTLFWTGVQTAQAQQELGDVLDEKPPVPQRPAEAATPPKRPGDPYLRMRIPRLGQDWEWVVVNGISEADLAKGPGHYPTTAKVGAVGNFAVAGHRATHGEPFANLDRVVPGDAVVFARRGVTWTYEITESFITLPSNTSVLYPVPGQAGVAPTERVLTITTCHPRWGSTERLILHGVLVGREPAGADEESTGAAA